MTPERIIENLKRLREAKGINQKEMASRLQVSPAMYNKLEKVEHSNPGLRTLAKICEAMEIEFSDLVRDPDVRNWELEEKLSILLSLPEKDREAFERMLEMTIETSQTYQRRKQGSEADRKAELRELSKDRDSTKNREH